MNKLIAVLGFSVLAACNVATGGTGAMTDGSPVVVQTMSDQIGFKEEFTLVSPEGWTCKTTLDWHKDLAMPNATVAQLPLACSDGQRGTAIITVPHNTRAYVPAGKSSIVFRLQNGRSGTVRY